MKVQWGTYIISLMVIPFLCSGHPQCLDFRPPFKSHNPLTFCKEYSDWGCCTVSKDRELEERHRETLAAVPDNKADECADMLRQVMCLKCSPYAAHLYDSEQDMVEAPFPGLCKGFCETFYDACNSVVPMLAEGLSGHTEESFCNTIKLTDEDYCYPQLLTNPVLTADLERTATTVEGCLCLEEFARDLRNALSFEMFPDGSGRILVSEQVGVVHVFFKNGTKIREPFMDLTDTVLTSAWEGDERGFLGVIFHPDFKTNKKFYCYFSVKHNNQQKVQISEYLVSKDNPNKVNVSYEKVLLHVDQPYWNHNGGEMLFGIDGYLYLFLGDGGGAGDPGDRAQNKGVLLGKVLRIDVNVPAGNSKPYLIPPDNPFVNESGSRPEIYAYGIRNIWRCDLDEGEPDTGYGRGRIICGDVGQSAYEEINIIQKGGNYGWNSREGFECYDGDLCGKIGEEILPIHAYPHSVGKSVTGGHVYRGCLNPALSGTYIFGDFVFGKLFKLEEEFPGGSWNSQEITMCGDDVCFNGLVNEYETHILSFGEDDDGEIYMLTTDEAVTAKPSAKIYKIVDPRRRGDPETCRSEKYRQENPTTTTTAAAAAAKTPSETYTSGSPIPRPELLPTYLVITTCIMVPFVTCVTDVI